MVATPALVRLVLVLEDSNVTCVERVVECHRRLFGHDSVLQTVALPAGQRSRVEALRQPLLMAPETPVVVGIHQSPRVEITDGGGKGRGQLAFLDEMALLALIGPQCRAVARMVESDRRPLQIAESLRVGHKDHSRGRRFGRRCRLLRGDGRGAEEGDGRGE